MVVGIMKVIVGLVAIAILIVALGFGWAVLEIKYIGPWQHERNTEKAETFNQTTWETGFADIYTIEAAIKVTGENRSFLVDVVCAPKIVTATATLKNGSASSHRSVRNFSPRYRYITVSDGYRAIVSTQFSCNGLAKDAKEQGLPFDLANYLRPSLQLSAEARVSCFGHPDGGVSQYYYIWGSPIAVLSRNTERIRDVLTREEYGPADLAIIRERKRERNEGFYIRTDYLSFERSFYWSSESMCWRDRPASNPGVCSAMAQTICEPSL